MTLPTPGPNDVWGAQVNEHLEALEALFATLTNETRNAKKATTPALVLAYVSPVTDPDLYCIRYAPGGGIAAGLAETYRATFVLNERGLLRLQAAPDQPDDVPLKIFGRGDTKQFTSAPFQVIRDRNDQANTVIFEIDPDGRIDTGRYAWTNVTGTTNPTRYTAPGSGFHPAGIRRVSSDRCEFRGQFDVSDNTIAAGDVIGVLPAEFRPSRMVRVAAFAAGGAQSVRLEIGTDGTLTLQTSRSAAGYLSLDGVSYTL